MIEKIKPYVIKHPFYIITVSYIIIFLLSSSIIAYFSARSLLIKHAYLVLERLDTLVKIANDFQDYSINHFKYRKKLKQNIEQLMSQNFLYIQLFDKKEKLVMFSINTDDKKLKNKINNYISKIKKTDFSKYSFKIKHFFYKGMNFVFYKKIDKTGYFFGVYKLPEKEFIKLKNEIINNILTLSIIIFSAYTVSFLIILFLTNTIERYTNEIFEAHIYSLKTIGTMVAKRDSETGEHNYRVTYYTVKIAENFKTEKINFYSLILGAFLHDIGKIAISDSILLKPGKLTKKEFEIIKNHVKEGYDIISKNKHLLPAKDTVLYHHEKVNGKGYLAGLRGEDIPINARIFAVADVFDALTSKRPYKKALSFEESMDIIIKDTGEHFCEKVVAVFKPIAFEMYNKVKGLNEEELHKIVIDIIEKHLKI